MTRHPSPWSTAPAKSRLVLTLAAALALLGGAAASPSSVSGMPGRPPWTRPFTATSSWNTPLPPDARYDTTLTWPASNGHNYGANWEQYAPGLYHSAESDPLVTVDVDRDSWGNPAGDYVLRMPRDATAARGTDGELMVVDGTTVWNFWQVRRTGETTCTAAAVAKTDLWTGTGWGTKNPFVGAGITAAGSSMLAGLVVQAETDAGEIEHALHLVVDGIYNVPIPVGEAINADGRGPAGQADVVLHEGQRLAIPPSTPIPEGLSPLGGKVARALKTYGAFDVDSSDRMTGLRVQSNAYDAPTVEALRADLGRLVPLLQTVDVDPPTGGRSPGPHPAPTPRTATPFGGITMNGKDAPHEHTSPAPPADSRSDHRTPGSGRRHGLDHGGNLPGRRHRR